MKYFNKQLFYIFTVLLILNTNTSSGQWIKKGATGGIAIGESITTDISGNVFSTGTYFCNLVVDGDTLFNPTCTDLTGIPRFDGFVVKYNDNGVRQWARQIIGEKLKSISINGISTDNNGDCYITGSYTGTLNFSGTTITNNASLQDIFIARYLADGTFDWVKNNFARRTDAFIEATSIATDISGNSFITGIHQDTIIFETDTLFPSLTQEFFVAKYNATGNYQWAFSSRGDSSDSEIKINDIVLDASNHFYITGTFKDTVTIFPGDTLKSVPLQSGIFTAQYNDPPSLGWAVQEDIDGASSNGITLDKTFANVFIAGQYKGAATIGVDILPPSGTDFAAFASKYDNLGNFSWAKNTSVTIGDSSAIGKSIGVDEYGGVYLAGSFGKRNSNSSVTSGITTKVGFQEYDGFITKFDDAGNLKWIQTLGGNANDEIKDIFVIDSLNVCIGGYFSNHMRVDSNEVFNDNSGGLNSFTAKIDVCPYYEASVSATGPTTFCRKDSVLLTATAGVGFTYQWQKNKIDIPGASSINYYASDSASYRVIITNPDIPCIKYSTPIFIKVNPLPTAPITLNNVTTFCTGQNVRISTAQGYKYQWLNAGAIMTNDTTFAYLATTTGVYSVIARNSYGCIDTSSITNVTVIPYPVPVLTPASKFVFCNGDSVTLTANTGAGYTYKWLKNNIEIPLEITNIYKAKTTGIYKVEISNSLGCATVSSMADTVTTIITPPATITLSGSDTYCTYNSSTLIANSGVGLYYIWERNGAALLIDDTLASYIPLISGDYNVKVRNGIGCEATSAIQTITINTQPTTTLTAGGTVSFCNGNSVSLDASTGGGYSYKWYKNGTELTGIFTSSYIANTTGNYNVIITGPNACSDTSSAITVTTNPTPTANITSTGATSFCIGDSIELKGSSGTGFTYVWKRDGAPILGATSINYKAKQTGLYTVEITSSSLCSNESAGTTVTVFTSPPANIINLSPTTFCDIGSVTLQGNTGGVYSYIWRKNGFVIPDSTNSSFVARTSGDYTVQVSITGTCTTTSSATTVTAKSNIKPIITTNGTNISTAQYNSYEWRLDNTPIAGASLQIYDAVTNGAYTVHVVHPNNCIATSDPITVCVPAPFITTTGSLLKGSAGTNWQWYLDDILINGATGQNYFAQASGNYKVKVRDITSCESFSVPVLVCVPAPTITLGTANILTASTGLSYQWYRDEIEITGANTQLLIAESSGSYTVKVEDNNACESFSVPLVLNITNTKNRLDNTNVSVFPNPSSNSISVSISNEILGQCSIEVLDLTGTTLSTSTFEKNNFEFECKLSLDELPNGTYLVRIMDINHNQIIKKINKINY